MISGSGNDRYIWSLLPRIGFCGLLLLLSERADAHRLEGFLQAALIAIAPEQIDVELSLTPGVDIAPAILAEIDHDHDGKITDSEGRAYAKQVLKAVGLKLDDKSLRLELVESWFPAVNDMCGGLGAIRLSLRAKPPAVSPGRHELHFHNQHQTNISQYLVNALVPQSRAIVIEQQHRDERQTEIRIGYSVASPPTNETAARSRQ